MILDSSSPAPPAGNLISGCACFIGILEPSNKDSQNPTQLVSILIVSFYHPLPINHPLALRSSYTPARTPSTMPCVEQITNPKSNCWCLPSTTIS